MPTTPDTAFKPQIGAKEALAARVDKNSETARKGLLSPDVEKKLEAVQQYLKPNKGKEGLERVEELFSRKRNPEGTSLETTNTLRQGFGAGEVDYAPRNPTNPKDKVQRVVDGSTPNKDALESAKQAENAINGVTDFLKFARMTKEMNEQLTELRRNDPRKTTILINTLKKYDFQDTAGNVDFATYETFRNSVLDNIVNLAGLHEVLGIDKIDPRDRRQIVEDALATNPRLVEEVSTRLQKVSETMQAQKYDKNNPKAQEEQTKIDAAEAKKKKKIDSVLKTLADRKITGISKDTIEDVINNTLTADRNYDVEAALIHLREAYLSSNRTVSVALERQEMEIVTRELNDRIAALTPQEISRNPNVKTRLEAQLRLDEQRLEQHRRTYEADTTTRVDKLNAALSEYAQFTRLIETTKTTKGEYVILGTDLANIAQQQKAIDASSAKKKEYEEADKPRKDARLQQESTWVAELEDIIGESVITVLKEQEEEVRDAFETLFSKETEAGLADIAAAFKNRYMQLEASGRVAIDKKGNKLRDLDQIGTDIRFLANHPEDGIERLMLGELNFIEEVRVPVYETKYRKVKIVSRTFNPAINVQKDPTKPPTYLPGWERHETESDEPYEDRTSIIGYRTIQQAIDYKTVDLNTLDPAKKTILDKAVTQYGDGALDQLFSAYATASIEDRTRFRGHENPAIRLTTMRERVNLQDAFGDLIQKKLEAAAPGETDEAKKAQIIELNEKRKLKKISSSAYAAGAATLLGGGFGYALLSSLFSEAA